MSDEEMDDFIKEAVSKHHATYNDKAWEKMNALLDIHLSHKRTDRRFLYLLFVLLLGSGGIFIGLHYNNNKTSHTPDISNTQRSSASQFSIPHKNLDDKSTTGEGKFASDHSDNTAALVKSSFPLTGDGNRINKSRNLTDSKRSFTIYSAIPTIETTNNSLPKKTIKKGTSSKENKFLNSKTIPGDSSLLSVKVEIDKSYVQPGKDVRVSEDSLILKKESKEIDKLVENISSSSEQEKKRKHKIQDNFVIHFSSGPGMPFIGSGKPGQLRINYGVGLGYTLSKRITLATGLNISRKVYSAKPSDYHPPSIFWSYYDYLQKIDANCKVYEVPLTLFYNFLSHNKHNWFLSSGISSYIMKTEDYNYEYKNSSGQLTYKSYSLSNENKHYFSILTLSGGYSYKLNSWLAFSAEPYIKLPLSGIGYGKVKLHDTGVLFTLELNPFHRKK